MTLIFSNVNSFSEHAPLIDKDAEHAPPITPRVQPHAQKITLPPELQAVRISLDAPSLAQREARAAKSPPVLVRQARYAALPPSDQFFPSFGNISEVVQAKRLPTIKQFIASVGPIRSHTLLERVLSFLGLSKPSLGSQNILAELAAYHDACRVGTENVQEAMKRLEKLAEIVDRYHQQGNDDPAGVIEDMREQISSERSALANLTAELKDSALPKDISLLHALGCKHEGLSLKQMVDLHAKGLTLVEPRDARALLENEKLAAAFKDQPNGFWKILGDLDQYHSACTAHNINTDAHSDLSVAEQAMELLNTLSISTQKYLDTSNWSSLTKSIKNLQDQNSIERRVLQGVIDELHNGGKLPEGTDLSHALAFAREGVSLKDMDRLIKQGLQPNQAADARMVLDSELADSIVNRHANLTPEQRTKARQGFNEEEFLLLELSGLGVVGGKEYKRLGIPITRQTVAIECTDEQRLDNRKMKRLGKGGGNEVFKARYIGSDRLFKGAFKPLNNKDEGRVAHFIGINAKHPQTANRNLATQDVARALGFDVVVDAQIGSRREPRTQKLQIGLVMSRASGTAAADTPADAFKYPEVRREITKLQLLDHLVGQGDRHSNNYFIHLYKDVNGQIKAKVSGIDNDQCFGKNTLHGDDIRYERGDKSRRVFRGTSMPQLIDTNMATAIRNITPEFLSVLLSDKLNEAEVRATQSRLQSMLEHVNNLETQGQILTPEQWNSNADTQADQNENNSYAFRDAEKLRF